MRRFRTFDHHLALSRLSGPLNPSASILAFALPVPLRPTPPTRPPQQRPSPSLRPLLSSSPGPEAPILLVLAHEFRQATLCVDSSAQRTCPFSHGARGDQALKVCPVSLPVPHSSCLRQVTLAAPSACGQLRPSGPPDSRSRSPSSSRSPNPPRSLPTSLEMRPVSSVTSSVQQLCLVAGRQRLPAPGCEPVTSPRDPCQSGSVQRLASLIREAPSDVRRWCRLILSRSDFSVRQSLA